MKASFITGSNLIIGFGHIKYMKGATVKADAYYNWTK